MASIQIAESTKHKKGPKTLDHMEIHPKMGGGHIVKHVYSGYEHDPMEVHFDEDGKRQGKGSGGEHVMAHLQKHAGLPRMQATNPTMQEEEEEEEE